MQIKLVT